MKVKFKFGIKSYSGTLDDLVYANYADRSVVVGRMLAENRELTEQNVTMGSRMSIISAVYGAASNDFKEDLAKYAKKMYKLKEFSKRIAGNSYSVFTKVIWNASKDTENPLDIDTLTVDDLEMGSLTQISDVKTIVENGYLPVVDGYETYQSSINA